MSGILLFAGGLLMFNSCNKPDDVAPGNDKLQETPDQAREGRNIRINEASSEVEPVAKEYCVYEITAVIFRTLEAPAWIQVGAEICTRCRKPLDCALGNQMVPLDKKINGVWVTVAYVDLQRVSPDCMPCKDGHFGA